MEPRVDLGYLLCIVNRLDREAQLSLNEVECLLQAISEIKHHREHVKEKTQ